MNIQKQNLILILLLFFVFSCNAPRENPFDPSSSTYQGKVKTTITVKRLFSQNEGISGVRITSDELHLSDLTSSAGQIIWHHDVIDSIKIFVEKEGFFKDTTTFVLNTSQNNLSVFLNAKPRLIESKFISVYSPTTMTKLEMTAKIFDEDGMYDFTTVCLKQADYNFIDTLHIEQQIDDFTKSYRVFFDKNKLFSGIGNQRIPEVDFQLVVKNSTGDYIIFGPFFIRRVIVENLVLNTPNFNQRVTGNIEFSWDRINANYYHHYKISLNQIIGSFSIFIDEFGPIPSTENHFILSDPDVLKNLTTGEYIWTLWIEDQIGNVCFSNGMRFSYIK